MVGATGGGGGVTRAAAMTAECMQRQYGQKMIVLNKKNKTFCAEQILHHWAKKLRNILLSRFLFGWLGGGGGEILITRPLEPKKKPLYATNHGNHCTSTETLITWAKTTMVTSLTTRVSSVRQSSCKVPVITIIVRFQFPLLNSVTYTSKLLALFYSVLGLVWITNVASC
jgi:hypothetical protein